MAIEYFSVVHTAGKTVYFRFMDPSDGTVFDFDDDTWEANLAACTTPKLAATERTDLGDADESTYVAGTDLADMYNTAAAKQFVVQAVDDLATDEVIATAGFNISSGVRIVDAVGAPALAILKADKVIDIDETPWELVYYVQGAAQEAGNEIMRKALSQPDGTAVSSSDHIVGQEEHTT